MALLLAPPVMPSALRALWIECPTNPLQPTSLGMHLTFQPCARQFGPLPFMSLPQAVLPWHHQLHDDDVLGALRDQKDIWPQDGADNVLRESQLLRQVH